MTRIERIFKRCRVTLADKNGDVWDDDTLLMLLSEGHKDLCRHSKVVKGRYEWIVEAGQVHYTLPDDVLYIQRMTYDNKVLALLSHDDLDNTSFTRTVRDFGIHSTHYDWENDEGEPQAILFDKRNLNEIKVYPVPDNSIYETLAANSYFGTTAEFPDYDVEPPFGVPVDADELLTFDSAFGVIGSALRNKAALVCYYIKDPDDLDTVNDDLATPLSMDTALHYYVCGHAFMTDLNEEYQAKGAQQLGFYDRELQLATKLNRHNAVQTSQTDVSYRGPF